MRTSPTTSDMYTTGMRQGATGSSTTRFPHADFTKPKHSLVRDLN